MLKPEAMIPSFIVKPSFPLIFSSSFSNPSINHHPPHLPQTNRPAMAISTHQPHSFDPEAFNSVVMNTYTRYPLVISRGEGAILYDTSDTPYLDCVSGIATCTLGHAHRAIIAAVTAQMSRVTHVSNLYYIPEQGDLATWLVQNSPADKAFFCNSGAEANEAAIKLVRKKWHLSHPSSPPGTPVILTAHDSFHGRTLATLTATGQPKYHRNWWPLLDGFDYVTYNDVKDLQAAAARAGPNLAGVLLEALQGEGGVHPGTPAFFRAARDICDKVGALLICDEVQVGVGRTGKLWGFEHVGIEPDVFTVAKGLGGGVPIGAMCCKKECDVFEPGDHASTFGGNPLASAAGVAIGRELLERGVMKNAHERGVQLRNGLELIAAKYPNVIKEVRGLGLIIGVELNGIAAGSVVSKAMENRLLLVPAGPHVVRFVPPLVISESQIVDAIEKFEEALRSVIES